MEYLKKLEIVRDFMSELYNASTDPKEQQLYIDLESAYYIRYKREAPLLPLSDPPTNKPYINSYGEVVPPPPEYSPPPVPVKYTWGGPRVTEYDNWGGPPVTEEEWEALKTPPAKTWGDCVRERREYEKWFSDTYEKPKEDRDQKVLNDNIDTIRDLMNICNDLISDYEDAEEEDPDIDELDIKGHFKDSNIDNIIDGLFDIDTFISKLEPVNIMELDYDLDRIKAYLEDKLDDI